MTFAAAGLQFHYPQGIVGKAARDDGRCQSGYDHSEPKEETEKDQDYGLIGQAVFSLVHKLDIKYKEYSLKSIMPLTYQYLRDWKSLALFRLKKGHNSQKQMTFSCKRGLNIAQSGSVTPRN